MGLVRVEGRKVILKFRISVQSLAPKDQIGIGNQTPEEEESQTNPGKCHFIETFVV